MTQTENEQKWQNLINSFRKPDVNTQFHWGKYYHEHFARRNTLFLEDYCNLRIWQVGTNKFFVLFSQSLDNTSFEITNASNYLATTVFHAFEFHQKNRYEFFESYEYDCIQDKPYFHRIKYSVEKVKDKVVFSEPVWLNCTDFFIKTLSSLINPYQKPLD
jgi:hypothetical protein